MTCTPLGEPQASLLGNMSQPITSCRLLAVTTDGAKQRAEMTRNNPRSQIAEAIGRFDGAVPNIECLGKRQFHERQRLAGFRIEPRGRVPLGPTIVVVNNRLKQFLANLPKRGIGIAELGEASLCQFAAKSGVFDLRDQQPLRRTISKLNLANNHG
jgi:hypothetical protein